MINFLIYIKVKKLFILTKMNILYINSTSSQLKLNNDQKTVCGLNCYAYVNPYSIGVTTCGTYINYTYIIHTNDIWIFK